MRHYYQADALNFSREEHVIELENNLSSRRVSVCKCLVYLYNTNNNKNDNNKFILIIIKDILINEISS